MSSERAKQEYPPSGLVEDYDGDRYVDDEYGYDEMQRAAFDRGYVAALRDMAEQFSARLPDGR